MSSLRPIQPFRFLDLPAEIRNNIYDLMLCSWQDQLETEPGNASKVSRRCLNYPVSGFLRANKQIHREASDYMVKRNQFVRVTYRGIDIRSLFLDDGIPVVTTNARQVSNFRGYVMHLRVSKPVFAQNPSAFTEYEMMVLHADLPKLCDNLDFETVMADSNITTEKHASVNIDAIFSWSHHEILTPRIQEHLLKPVTQLRGIPDLRVQGPINPALATSVREDAAKPRWTDPTAILAEIHTGVDVGKRQWQEGRFYSASESWNYAMRTLERMRHSSSWLSLKQDGGEDFVNKTADLYFTLNLLSAAFLQVDMASEHAHPSLVRRNGGASLSHLSKCSSASALFARHADATWVPSNEQSGKMLYRQAKCYRLLGATQSCAMAVSFIDRAVILSPNDRAIRDEKDQVHAWAHHVEESQRAIEEQQLATEIQQNSSPWSYFVASVAELAA